MRHTFTKPLTLTLLLLAGVMAAISGGQAQRSDATMLGNAAEKGLSADKPADVQALVRGWLAMSFYTSEIRDRVLATLGMVLYNAHQETLLWKDAESHDLTEDLKHLTVPVLVTTGRFDANIAPRAAWRIHQAISGSQFVVWERSGHFPMIEEPDASFAVVDRFLRTSE